MAKSSVIGTKRDGTIRIQDLGPNNTMDIALDVGDFTFEEPKADRIVIRDRGTISGLRKGDDAVGSLSFSIHFSEFTNATAQCLMDFIYNRNFCSGFSSTGGNGYEQYLVDVKYTCDKTALGDAVAATSTFTKVLLFASFTEGDSDTMTVTGEVYGGYAYTGIA